MSGHYAADGSTNVTIVGGSASGPSETPPVSGASEVVPVAIVDGSGDQITSFGGGTQYTEGDTDASITGTAILWEDTSDTLVTVSASKPLPIEVTDSTLSVTQSGTWNIGTVTALTDITNPIAVTQSGTWDEVGINDSGNSITVDAPVGTPVFVRLSDGSSAISTLPVSLSSLPTLAAGTNNIGDVDVLTVPSDPFGANGDAASATGSISAKLRFIASTGIPITGTVTVGSHAVTNAGTFATQVDGSALTALQLIDDPVFADDATFTPATSKVMMVGAEFDDSSPDSVDEGDAGAIRMSANRNLYVRVRDNAGNERGMNVDANGRIGVTVASLPAIDEYETVAASQTGQVIGPTGATGDYIAGLLVVPATTAPGNVLLLDNATSITVFAGGTGSVPSLIPFYIPLGMTSVSGAWKVTTGANVSVIAIGQFT